MRECVTHYVSVYDGHVLSHSIVRSDLAWGDMLDQLQPLLRKIEMDFSMAAESDFCSTMNEEMYYVPNVPTKDVSNRLMHIR